MAYFQIGIWIDNDGLEGIQLRDYKLMINKKFIQDNSLGNKNTKFLPIEYQQITLNESFMKNLISSDDDFKNLIENHYLIPNIDSFGKIKGSMLLLNHKQSTKGIWKATNN